MANITRTELGKEKQESLSGWYTYSCLKGCTDNFPVGLNDKQIEEKVASLV